MGSNRASLAVWDAMIAAVGLASRLPAYTPQRPAHDDPLQSAVPVPEIKIVVSRASASIQQVNNLRKPLAFDSYSAKNHWWELFYGRRYHKQASPRSIFRLNFLDYPGIMASQPCNPDMPMRYALSGSEGYCAGAAVEHPTEGSERLHRQ